MTHEALIHFFGICTLINFGFLIFWFLLLMLARGLVIKVHSSMFGIPEARLLEIHFTLMGRFKLAVIMLNLVPYLALNIMMN